jgi:hypothetical protein
MHERTSLTSADPDGVSAKIDPIGVPWLMIGEEPSAVPNQADLFRVAGCRRHCR